MDRKGKQEKTGGMDCTGMCSAYGKRRKEAYGKSAEMSSRPMGWCRQGADSLAHISVYWKNGGDMLDLVKRQKEKETEEMEEEKYFSAGEILSWERKHSKTNGKYIEALQAGISSQISGKILFNNVIASVC